MTNLLQQAFDRASKLSQTEQDALATWLMEELESEREWDELFAKSEDLLAKLGEEALAEHRG